MVTAVATAPSDVGSKSIWHKTLCDPQIVIMSLGILDMCLSIYRRSYNILFYGDTFYFEIIHTNKISLLNSIGTAQIVDRFTTDQVISAPY